MAPSQVIILAAGDSTRLKSKLSKVMHPICGRPMIDYVLEAARSLKPKKICLVLGNDRKKILEHLKGQRGMVFAHQKERRGTAHAVQVGFKALGSPGGNIFILNGDVPLLNPATLKKLSKIQKESPLAFLTAVLPDPFGYGRILRNREGQVLAIVEEKNASPQQRQINEINAGVYRVAGKFLQQALKRIKKDPVKGEYYITELVTQSLVQGNAPHALVVDDPHEVLGANNRAELAYLNQSVRSALVADHLARGVGMADPDSAYIDFGIRIGADSYLGPGVQLSGKTKIGQGCVIESGCLLKDCVVQDGVHLKAYSYLEDCTIQSQAVVGPFARVRPGSIVGQEARIGNFVELKKTRLGKGSKANHLSYLGDTVVGKGANIGAGTITCNYDGRKKYKTIISDGAFIGSDTQLVAPVKIGKGAYVGAGTTVTKDVPPKALATSRVLQRNIKKS